MSHEDAEEEQGKQTREITGVRTAPTFLENPFMVASITEIKGKKKHYNIASKSSVVVNSETGEVTGNIEHRIVKYVDDSKFIKLYQSGVIAQFELGSAGGKVFRFLFDVVQKNPNTDRLYLFFMDAIEEPWNISKSVFFRGMTELLEKQFIARSRNPNMFYLNPNMIWNGDRFAFVTEYVKKKNFDDMKSTEEDLGEDVVGK